MLAFIVYMRLFANILAITVYAVWVGGEKVVGFFKSPEPQREPNLPKGVGLIEPWDPEPTADYDPDLDPIDPEEWAEIEARVQALQQ